MKKGQKMEEKYNPDTIIMNTWKQFSVLNEYKGSDAHDFQVYIEIQPREDDMYVIGGYKSNCFLLKYSIIEAECRYQLSPFLQLYRLYDSSSWISSQNSS